MVLIFDACEAAIDQLADHDFAVQFIHLAAVSADVKSL